MSDSDYTVLLVDPDKRTRALVAEQLSSTGCAILHASDGNSALEIVNKTDIRLVVTEMYLKAGDDDDLIHAIRRSKKFRKTRTLAHTSRSTPADRDWAMRAGADAFLIKPTRAERMRYVVSRLASARGANSSLPATSASPVTRRDSLEVALADLERGALQATSSIVFSRAWWEELTLAQQTKYRKRAKKVGVGLRSDSMLANHFVEVRGGPGLDQALSTEQAESPYKRATT